MGVGQSHQGGAPGLREERGRAGGNQEGFYREGKEVNDLSLLSKGATSRQLEWVGGLRKVETVRKSAQRTEAFWGH